MLWRRSKQHHPRWSRLESLENRSMLSGHGLAVGFAGPENPAALHGAASISTLTIAHLGSITSAQGAASAETKLVAQLADPNSSATGSAAYKTETEHGVSETELDVNVAGATPNSTLSVTIGDAVTGVVVGQVVTDATGAGKLVLSSNPHGTGQPLPANFPTSISAGTAISVGTLGGSLAVPTSGTGESSSETSLKATLSDPNNASATGTVCYQTETEHGTTTTTLSVNVAGATPNSTLSVTIGDTATGVVVGQVVTDATGAGKLVLSSNPHGAQQPLPANFPTGITAGTTVSVGTLGGTLAVPTGGEHGSENETELHAALADPNSSTAGGSVSYETGTEHGVTKTTFAVSVTGATPSSTLNVVIGDPTTGTIVGQLVTDATGAGQLVLSSNPHGTQQALPANFPTSIAAGTTVSVGTLTGTLG